MPTAVPVSSVPEPEPVSSVPEPEPVSSVPEPVSVLVAVTVLVSVAVPSPSHLVTSLLDYWLHLVSLVTLFVLRCV
jgi:hypothetical protein